MKKVFTQPQIEAVELCFEDSIMASVDIADRNHKVNYTAADAEGDFGMWKGFGK